jgi:hypothetical protein
VFGADPRLETWKTSVVEGIHVHSIRPDEPCPAEGIGQIAGKLSQAIRDQDETTRHNLRDLGRTMNATLELMMARSSGPAHGGADRTVVALRREATDETIIVDLPRLRPEEGEHTFRAGDVKAVYERPSMTAEAALVRGWVRAVRYDAGAVDYDLFLVLKPVRREAGESMQVVARVSWPPR